jgi:IMP and pyridine-specific 5'-nucleotidase
MATAPSLKLICFDGDGTLYADGANFDYEPLATILCTLLAAKMNVALITAAGYGFDGEKYETRLSGLLDVFRRLELNDDTLARFFVLGGECNFLLRCGPGAHLVRVMDEEWQHVGLDGPKPRAWAEEDCQHVLDVAEESLKESMSALRLRACIIRKPRGVGLIPGGTEAVAHFPSGHGSNKIKSEALDEVVLRAQERLRVDPRIRLPWCAFNGGRDAWVDVGNKCIGVRAMQAFLRVSHAEALHVGDQFLKTGNDVAARECCPCIWITSPNETLKVLEILLGMLNVTTTTTMALSLNRNASAYSYAVPELAVPTSLLTSPRLSSLLHEPAIPFEHLDS